MPDQRSGCEQEGVPKSIYVLRTPDNRPVNVAGFGSKKAAKAARDGLAAKGIVTVVSRGLDHPQGPSFPAELVSLPPARLAQPEPKQEPSPRPTSSKDPFQSSQQRLTGGETLSTRAQPSSNLTRLTLKERLKKHPVAAAVVSFFILNILIMSPSLRGFDRRRRATSRHRGDQLKENPSHPCTLLGQVSRQSKPRLEYSG